jgi:hypothetical protein
MSGGTYPITGIPLVGGPIPLRKEVTAWYNDYDDNKYQISLFMQALAILKERPVEDMLSFFQIAGRCPAKNIDRIVGLTKYRYPLLSSRRMGWRESHPKETTWQY